MRMNGRNNKFKNLFLALMLIVAMALTVTGCGDKSEAPRVEPQSVEASDAGQQPAENQESQESQSQENPESQESQETQSQSETTVLGEGQTQILFIMIDKDGNETNFEIHTDKETVSEALQEHGLIAGEESEYGLYVKQVNGITADYNVDQTYWAFYVNGEYATAGVDSTPVKEGETYSFKVEK